jgi:hypothetical protein
MQHKTVARDGKYHSAANHYQFHSERETEIMKRYFSLVKFSPYHIRPALCDDRIFPGGVAAGISLHMGKVFACTILHGFRTQRSNGF